LAALTRAKTTSTATRPGARPRDRGRCRRPGQDRPHDALRQCPIS